MKITAQILVALLVLLAAPLATQAAETESNPKVKSLRGTDVQAPDTEPETYRQERDRGVIERNFTQQPPLIPHTVENYKITKNFNKCMDCHSWSRYKEMGATKVSITHFKDREGVDHANISPRRYFCVQCHVPQTDARPLVENTYIPANSLR
jgi:nitrate reductase (cytochrome), electron transfer subunit